MTKKTFLSKVLPAALVFILVLLLVVVISSCSRTKKTPTGSIENVDDYITVTLSNGDKVSVSKIDFYNQLRYGGYSTFVEELDSLIFASNVEDIKKDLDANESDLSKSKYYDKLVDYVNQSAYNTKDEDAIKDLDADEKTVMENKFLATLTIAGAAVDNEKGLYQRGTFDYFLVQLAKAEYARTVLNDDAKEVDGEYEITQEDLSTYYDTNFKNQGDVSALIIIFSSSTEVSEVLKALQVKFVKDNLYYVAPVDGKDYDDVYDDFDVTKEGVSHLQDNEVLLEFARIYNYMYSTYRPGLSLTLDVALSGESDPEPVDVLNLPLDDFNDPINHKRIYAALAASMTVEDITEALLANDRFTTGDENDPKISYAYDDLYSYDTTLCSDIYTKYLANSTTKPTYTTTAGTFEGSKYLTYKLVDSQDSSLTHIKTLAEFADAVKDGSSTEVVNTLIRTLSEYYNGQLKKLGIYDDDDILDVAKAKDFFYGDGSTTGLANTITVDNITGAKKIIDSAWDKENKDSLYSKVFDERLTDDYISKVVTTYVEDNVKIVIYDELFEVQYASNFEFYKKSNKQSEQYVASVEINGEIKYLTAEHMYSILERKYGANKALELVVNQILKDKYYDKISAEDLESFETEYENTLTYFATGQSSSYGYPASIGQKAFMQLYFRAENKEDAIFNMWVVEKLQKLCVFENPTDIYSNIYNDLRDLTDLTYDQYFNLGVQKIVIYTDDDEDGKKDDWTLVADDNPRKQTVMKYAAELMDVITSELAGKTSTQGDAYATIAENYQNSSRFSKIGYVNDTPVSSFNSTAERNSYLWGKFKQQGLFVYSSKDNYNSFETIDAIKDEDLINQYTAIYQYFESSETLMIDGKLANTGVETTFAKKVTADFLGDHVDVYNESEKTIKGELCVTKEGFVLANITSAEDAPSAKFEEKDNDDDATNGKVYPYSLNADTPFPVDSEGKPINNIDAEDTLYNKNDKATANQIAMYIREYSDGIESLQADVTTALKTFFDAKVYSIFISSSFNYVIYEDIMEKYLAEGKVTFKNENLLTYIHDLVDAQSEALFDYKTTDFSEAWWKVFK